MKVAIFHVVFWIQENHWVQVKKIARQTKSVGRCKILSMNTNSVTYQDVINAIADLPSENWALLIEFARMLQAGRWVVRPQTQTAQTEKILANDVARPDERHTYVAANGVEVVTFPATSLLSLTGLFNSEGNALEDSERLYDGRD